MVTQIVDIELEVRFDISRTNPYFNLLIFNEFTRRTLVYFLTVAERHLTKKQKNCACAMMIRDYKLVVKIGSEQTVVQEKAPIQNQSVWYYSDTYCWKAYKVEYNSMWNCSVYSWCILLVHRCEFKSIPRSFPLQQPADGRRCRPRPPMFPATPKLAHVE